MWGLTATYIADDMMISVPMADSKLGVEWKNTMSLNVAKMISSLLSVEGRPPVCRHHSLAHKWPSSRDLLFRAVALGSATSGEYMRAMSGGPLSYANLSKEPATPDSEQHAKPFDPVGEYCGSP